ncbi:MAG: J domain-containing protein [Phycisphaerae bacterium]|nr:J domain-containing protein [Phycisphaerae bacterium]MCZ2399120.1 J domain-containing protein [Phycisphaerae bacterium]
MSSKDPYEILGVSRTASQDEVKRAYRRLAKAHHPDRNPGSKVAEQRFKEIQAAYEVLGDPQRRAQYDRFGAGGPTPEFRSWSPRGDDDAVGVHFGFDSLGDLGSIFEQFFRRGPQGAAGYTARTGSTAARGGDVEHSVEVSFEESIRGTTREVHLRGADGTSERIEFRIPPGVTDGQRIRVRGRGNPGPGGRGHLIIVCRVRPDAHFRREGRDLVVDLPVSFPQAALGGSAAVRTLDGPVRIKVPPGATSGTRLRLRGKGVPDPRGGEPGDLYAVVQVTVPRELSETARELIRRLEAELEPRVRAGAEAK